MLFIHSFKVILWSGLYLFFFCGFWTTRIQIGQTWIVNREKEWDWKWAKMINAKYVHCSLPIYQTEEANTNGKWYYDDQIRTMTIGFREFTNPQFLIVHTILHTRIIILSVVESLTFFANHFWIEIKENYRNNDATFEIIININYICTIVQSLFVALATVNECVGVLDVGYLAMRMSPLLSLFIRTMTRLRHT